MIRFVAPIILIGISIVVFFTFTSPLYSEISLQRTEVTAYDEALNNSKTLENERDKLTAKYNAINPDNLIKLQKLLPGSIDNIRLVLEIEQIALPYGMALKNVKYNTTSALSPTTTTPGELAQLANKNYGVWDLEFSTTGTYNNFLNFTRDLENNLRIVDIVSIDFSSATGGVAGSADSSAAYTYNFKIKTYWLKN